MKDYQIKTIESRRFDIVGSVSPIEVEFHQEPSWAEDLDGFVSRVPPPPGLALSRYASRVALTGSALPPITLSIGHGEPLPLAMMDVVDLGLMIASFGRMPASEDYSEGSRYHALRSQIESLLGVQHIHLGLRGGERQAHLEVAIDHVAERLAEYSLAFSSSPPLSFLKFADLVKKGGRIFSFQGGADALLGTSALAGAYQLAILSNPVLAIELVGAGAAAYVVLKFGAAVGKKVEQIINRW